MCVDKTLGELSTFAALVAEAERIEKDWQIVLVAGLAGRNGVAPSSDDAEEPLKMMLHAVKMVETSPDIWRLIEREPLCSLAS
jgi:hypothetical protein